MSSRFASRLRVQRSVFCQGPAIRPTAKALKRAYDAVPALKLVLAIGSCTCGGGVWFDSYNLLDPIEKIIPVNYYIPGCPPRPEAIIYGVAIALGIVDKKSEPVQFKRLELPIPRYYRSDVRGEGELVAYEKVEKV